MNEVRMTRQCLKRKQLRMNEDFVGQLRVFCVDWIHFVLCALFLSHAFLPLFTLFLTGIVKI